MRETIPVTMESAEEMLKRLGYDKPEPPPKPASSGQHSSSNGPQRTSNSGFDVRAFLARHGVAIKSDESHDGGSKLILEECVFDPAHKAPDAAVFIGADGKLGYKCFHNSCAGYRWADVREKLDPRAQRQRTQQQYQQHGGGPADQGLPPISYERLTAAELDAATYDLEYLLEDTLTAGQPAIIAGGKKCLKTNIILDAAISLPTGLPFLGQIQVTRKVRTAVMTGESGMATVQETARRICDAKGIALADVPTLIFSPDLPRIGDFRHQEALEKFLTHDGIEALFLDPAYLCLPAEDNGNLFAMGMLLRNITEVCQAVGATLFLVHHTKKNIVDPFAPPELESIAWSGFQEFARQWWLIGRRETYEPGTGHHKLWFNVGGSAGHSALWALDIAEGTRATPGGRFWSVSLNSAAEARHDAKTQREAAKATQREEKQIAAIEAARSQISKALAKVPEGETKRWIRDTTGLRPATVDAAIASLWQSGDIVECQITKGAAKKGWDGWKLA